MPENDFIMRKFSKILESASGMQEEIKMVFVAFLDEGFTAEIRQGSLGESYDVVLKHENRGEIRSEIELMSEFLAALGRIEDMGFSSRLEYFRMGSEDISKKDSCQIRVRFSKEAPPASSVSGWNQFKEYCENVLGIKGIQGGDDDESYFRIDVVDKDSGWPGLPDKYAGWGLDIYDATPEDFSRKFPGYEDFMLKLAKRKINWNLVWHLVSDENDRYNRNHIISDPAKLEEVKKGHNPMKFDADGIEAVKTLIEMSEKLPGLVKVNR
jgi:hypothetical protein